ncbi:DUF4954 family protein [bacterium]|nr:DUF4954 family protein [bacterium]
MTEAVVVKDTASVLKHVEQALVESPVIKAAKENKTPCKGRKLTQPEIDQLTKQNNCCMDWSKITVAEDFIADNIMGSYFEGAVFIGRFSGYKSPFGEKFWAGIANSAVFDSDLLGESAVISVRWLGNYRVYMGCMLFNVGTLAVCKESSFGCGIELPIAIETGGREVLVYPEITVDVADKVATTRSDKEFIAKYEELVKKYAKEATSSKGTILSQAQVLNTNKVVNAFIGEGAVIDNATLVDNATIYSLPDEKTEILDGAYVKSAVIQWGCEVASMAIVSKSALVEHSHVERHGKVTDSLIGPNTGIAEGEVTACLVGPFVGFHHQSLLIAAYWPEGKGNIGYGANVGSNHTSKAPDQELWAGEGLFYGLSVNIKFPSDYSRSPYSIIATAVSALPQKLEFPFSLVNTPSEILPGISPAYNELMPGWVLSDNIFTIKRNEGKYMKRNKAKRSKLVFEVFRPEIVDLMIDARARLQNVKETKEWYTSREVKGLGKNYMSDESRLKGIEAYTFYLKYYALTGLYRLAKHAVEKGNLDKVKKCLEPGQFCCERWEHERTVLLKELPGKTIPQYLALLAEMEEQIAKSVEVSKSKDDKRGATIIPDYAEAHSPASQDGFVKETWTKTKALQEDVKKLSAQLS